ncbi:hypothetical protein [Slackia isoflavoniconvertens]|uniref:hypothetical protein n=1 Tax=Slackia isoflavoniconvertens TaxID=572010 RepID=UPI000F62EC84
MDDKNLRLLGAAEVSDQLGVCRSKAYQIIKELNAEMAARGCRTIPGRVSSQLLEETFFSTRGARHGR